LNKPLPYIGMTGFSSSTEVAEALEDASDTKDPETGAYRYLIMLGVLVSDKSLARVLLDQPKRYPPPEALGNIFPQGGGYLNILHVNAKGEALLQTMLRARELAGPHCHGVQINKTWPSPSILKAYLREYPGDTLILQCGTAALKEVSYSSRRLVEQVSEYKELATHVLIDPSGGTGMPFDVVLAQQCFAALHELPFGLGIAGGLSSANMHKLHRLAKFWPFSIDVESGLRTPKDDFDSKSAYKYLKLADNFFSEQVSRNYQSAERQEPAHEPWTA
jgi:hypothetical protein